LELNRWASRRRHSCQLTALSQLTAVHSAAAVLEGRQRMTGAPPPGGGLPPTDDSSIVFMNMVDIDFHLAQIAKLMSSLRWWIPLISYFKDENLVTRGKLAKILEIVKDITSFLLLQEFFFAKKKPTNNLLHFLIEAKGLLFLLDPTIAKKFTLSAPPTMRLIVAFIDRRSSFQFR
jgi:hypothetical protein